MTTLDMTQFFIQEDASLFGAVSIQMVTGPSATVAEVEFAGHSATGEAKRMPADPHSDEVATCLAVGRALEALADSLIRYGMARSHVLSRS